MGSRHGTEGAAYGRLDQAGGRFAGAELGQCIRQIPASRRRLALSKGEELVIDATAVDEVAGGIEKDGFGGLAGVQLPGEAQFRIGAADGFDDRSELMVFYSLRQESGSRWQVYALAGLSDGSPDLGAGVSYSHRF